MDIRKAADRLSRKYKVEEEDLAIVILRAELRQDLDFIELNYRKNREMSLRIEKIDSDDEYQFAALG